MIKRSRCSSCSHLNDDGRCKAFPYGIPDEILSGEISHDTAIDGDGGFVYSARPVSMSKGGVGSGDKDGHPFRGNQYTDGFTTADGVSFHGTGSEEFLSTLERSLSVGSSEIAAMACLPESAMESGSIRLLEKKKESTSVRMSDFLSMAARRISSHYGGVAVTEDEAREILTDDSNEGLAREIWPNLDAVLANYHRIAAMEVQKTEHIRSIVKAPGVVADRTFVFDGFGDVVEIVCNSMAIDKDVVKESGTELFYRMVDAASGAGIKRLITYAAGNAKDPSLNGYYTWARLGYNNTDDLVVDVVAPDGVGGVRNVEKDGRRWSVIPRGSLHAVMESELGRDWWRRNGFGFDAEFNLHSGSRSIAVLEAYIKKRFGK